MDKEIHGKAVQQLLIHHHFTIQTPVHGAARNTLANNLSEHLAVAAIHVAPTGEVPLTTPKRKARCLHGKMEARWIGNVGIRSFVLF